MPTYNDRQFINEAVESILNQTFASWELIIVDDASTDGTADIVERAFSDPRISLIRMETNSGSGACRNRAIEAARGEFIAVMDADDISLPSRLEKQVERMRADPELAAVSAQVLEFGNWGGPLQGSWPTATSEIVRRQMTSKMPIPHPATMFRKSDVVEAGGYDVKCRRAQDYSLFLALSKAKLETLAEPLVMYRTTRPISLGYVLRNEQYAALARARASSRAKGLASNELPTDPRKSPAIYYRALKSWTLRNTREQFAGLFGRRMHSP